MCASIVIVIHCRQCARSGGAHLDVGTASLELSIGEVGAQFAGAGAMLVDDVARVGEDQGGGPYLNIVYNML